MSPFLLPALQAISELVPALANTLFNKDKSVPERNVEAATQIIEVAKKAAEASNEQELVEKIRSDPTAMKMVREAVTPLAALVEAGGGGIAGAREYSLKAADIPLYKQAAFVVALLLLPMIYGVVGFVMYSEAFDSNIKSFVVGVVVGSTLGAIVAHFLGSSTGSKTKTDAMIERARFGNV